MPSSKSEPIDDEDILLAKIVSDAAALPQISEDDSNRFATEVRRLVEIRAFSDWKDEVVDNDTAVFVLVKYPGRPLAKASSGLKRIIDLPASDRPVFGKLFFLSKDASNG
ncbi:MAG: hypothetical protein GY816_00435, partial [Cytophagales bacterium]|nr:hypothetical protein [Cytophagales bacterium]